MGNDIGSGPAQAVVYGRLATTDDILPITELHYVG